MSKSALNYLVDATSKYTLDKDLDITGGLTSSGDVSLLNISSDSNGVGIGGLPVAGKALKVVGDVTIVGDLSANDANFVNANISGSSTSVQTGELEVLDKTIRIETGQESALSNLSGILFGGTAGEYDPTQGVVADRNTPLESLLWSTADSRFELSSPLSLDGALTASSLSTTGDLGVANITATGDLGVVWVQY